MADLSFSEQEMFAKYYGDRELHKDDKFWLDVMIAYRDKVVPMPLQDNYASRRRLKEMLDCPGGVCAACCHYDKLHVSESDIKRLFKVIEDTGRYLETDENGKTFISCKNGCPFIKDMKCTVYENRPDVCAEFPIQDPREGMVGNTKFAQVQYRLKCPAALDVVKAVMTEAVELHGLMLLPDLTLINPNKKFDLREAK